MSDDELQSFDSEPVLKTVAAEKTIITNCNKNKVSSLRKTYRKLLFMCAFIVFFYLSMIIYYKHTYKNEDNINHIVKQCIHAVHNLKHGHIRSESYAEHTYYHE